MSAHPISAIYAGAVRHARYAPARHRFTYRVFSLFLNVDDLDADANLPALLSVDRFNLFSIRLKDHGPKDATKLRPFIDNLLAKRGLAQSEQIFILCYPRILGYAFNPLTVYYCLNDGAVSGLVYEVRNTFGDDHIYVVPVNRRGSETSLSHTRDKQMHVSPFIDMNATYHFSAPLPDDELRLVIRETQNNVPLLIASFTGHRRALTNRQLLCAFFQYPMMTLKVVAAIHFEAGRLFLKNVPFISRPSPPADRVSY